MTSCLTKNRGFMMELFLVVGHGLQPRTVWSSKDNFQFRMALLFENERTQRMPFNILKDSLQIHSEWQTVCVFFKLEIGSCLSKFRTPASVSFKFGMTMLFSSF